MSAIIWDLFSIKSKQRKILKLGMKFKNSDEKHTFHFFEEIVDLLRPQIRLGMKAIIVIQPKRLDIFESFQVHLHKHHQWLFREGKHQIVLEKFDRNVDSLEKLQDLRTSEPFTEFMESLLEDEADNTIQLFEELLNNESYIMLYRVMEAYDFLKTKKKQLETSIEYIFLTANYREKSKNKQFLQHFLQIAKNKNVLIKTFDSETSMGSRLAQFGGLVIFVHQNR